MRMLLGLVVLLSGCTIAGALIGGTTPRGRTRISVPRVLGEARELTADELDDEFARCLRGDTTHYLVLPTPTCERRRRGFVVVAPAEPSRARRSSTNDDDYTLRGFLIGVALDVAFAGLVTLGAIMNTDHQQ